MVKGSKGWSHPVTCLVNGSHIGDAVNARDIAEFKWEGEGEIP